MERTIHALLAARARGERLNPAELQRLAARVDKQHILRAIDRMDAPALRNLVRALVAVLDYYDRSKASVAGQRYEGRQQKRRSAQLSGVSRGEAAARILAAIEAKKTANPQLSDVAAARSYLRETDPKVRLEPDSKRVANLVLRVRRARRKKRSRT